MTLTWWWKRDVAERVAEALETGEPLLKVCADCRHFSSGGPQSTDRCLRALKIFKRDPVSGRRRPVAWTKYRPELEREGTSINTVGTTRCGRDAIFWVREPRWWKRAWRSLPPGAQFATQVAALILTTVLGMVALVIYLDGK